MDKGARSLNNSCVMSPRMVQVQQRWKCRSIKEVLVEMLKIVSVKILPCIKFLEFLSNTCVMSNLCNVKLEVNARLLCQQIVEEDDLLTLKHREVTLGWKHNLSV